MTNPSKPNPTPSTGAVLPAGRVVAADSNGVSSCAVLTTPLPHGTELYMRSDAQEEDAFVIARLGELLARIAIAVKGPQECLRLHSYHDLPELVEALVASSTPQPPPEQAGSVPDGFVLVPESALLWLNGEADDFECPPSRYFRGKPPTYWWRSVFREMIAAAPLPKGEPSCTASDDTPSKSRMKRIAKQTEAK